MVLFLLTMLLALGAFAVSVYVAAEAVPVDALQAQIGVVGAGLSLLVVKQLLVILEEKDRR